MSIQSEITRINSEVSEQESLINQIKTALEGKAAGGGGGVTKENATVSFTTDGNATIRVIRYKYWNNGDLTDGEQYFNNSNTATVQAAVGEVLINHFYTSYGPAFTCGSGIEPYLGSAYDYNTVLFKVTSTENATVHIVDDD